MPYCGGKFHEDTLARFDEATQAEKERKLKEERERERERERESERAKE